MNKLTVSFGSVALLALAACAPSSSSSAQVAEPGAHAEPPHTAPVVTAEPAQAAPAAALTRIADASQVCMVNNQFMGKPQIPVVVNGATYYGCCEMCKGKLTEDPTSRVAVDPVSNRSVDKAVAVMAKDAQGTVLYFENEANLSKYSSAVQ